MEQITMKHPDSNGKTRSFVMVVECECDGWLMGWEYRRGERVDRFRMVRVEQIESRVVVDERATA